MKLSRISKSSLMFNVCLGVIGIAYADQDSITVDTNGDYVITYQSYAGQQKVIYEPSTKINPDVRWAIKPPDASPDRLGYRYTIRNLPDSRQNINVLRLSASNVYSVDLLTPGDWSGDATLDRAAGTGFNVGWAQFRQGKTSKPGIIPGVTKPGFGFDSKDLPGVGNIALYGATTNVNNFPDEGPNEGANPGIIRQFREINEHDFVTRLTAVPRIKVPSPFDAATVLVGIKSHLDTDLVTMKLVDASLITELDRWLDAAIAAARAGNTKAVRADIQEARDLIKREYPDVGEDDGNKDKPGKPSVRIDWLAARVLDFDLRYVIQRLPGDDKG